MQCAASFLPYEVWCMRRAGRNRYLPLGALESMTMRTPIVASCSRCGDVLQCSTWDEISLCLSCLRLVVLEWAAHQAARESFSPSHSGSSDNFISPSGPGIL